MTDETDLNEDELAGHVHEALTAIRAEALPAKSFEELTGAADLPAVEAAVGIENGKHRRSRLMGVAVAAAAGLIIFAVLNRTASTDDGQTVASTTDAGERESSQNDSPSSSETEPANEATQLREGADWRLLLDAPVGSAHASWIATNESQYEELQAGLNVTIDDTTPVDFSTEVVLWFGVEENGNGCWHSQLNGVTVDSQASLIYGDVAWPTDGRVCTSDSAPRAYLVAVARSVLPEAPFSVQSIANIDDFYITTERTEVTPAILAGQAQPPSLALRLDGPPQNQPAQQPLDLFAEHSRWIATEFNGEPIVAGPWISSPEFSVAEPEAGQIDGCIMGALYDFSIDESRLLVDQDHPVGDYDCDDTLIFEQGIEALPAVVFSSPEIQLGPFRLELRSGDDSIVFRPFADNGALAGSWVVRTINETPATNTWELVFSAPNELGPNENGLAELRVCGEPVMATTYTPTQIGLRSGQPTNATTCANGTLDRAQDFPDLSVPYSEIHWLAQDRIRIFDGSTTLELEPLADS